MKLFHQISLITENQKNYYSLVPFEFLPKTFPVGGLNRGLDIEEVTRFGVLCSDSVDKGVVMTPVVIAEDEPNKVPLIPNNLLSSDEDGSVDTMTPPLLPLVDKEDVVFRDELLVVVGVLVIIVEVDIADVTDGVPICSITKLQEDSKRSQKYRLHVQVRHIEIFRMYEKILHN